MDYVYYTTTIFLTIFLMCIMQLFVARSNTTSKYRKHIFHFIFGAIALAALCEWLGKTLQDKGSSTRIAHIIVKLTEFSVMPSIAFMFALILHKENRGPIFGFLLVHFLLEAASGVFGFIYYVDANSHYYRGSFYWIYILAFTLATIYMLLSVLKNIKRFQYSGAALFGLIVIFMLSGVCLQMINSSIMISYLTVSVAGVMSYVFTLEMIQQTDELTELLNRRGYENYINHIDQRCAVLFFDVDSFKYLNDTYGHAFGDTVLKNVGIAIKKSYAHYGKCFRYGGDEFCVILTSKLESVEALNSSFFRRMEALRQIEHRIPNISIGYAYYDPYNNNIQDTIAEADQMMYKYKQRAKNALNTNPLK